MDAFDFLSHEHRHLDSKLKEYISEYPNMTPEEAMGRVSKVFDLLRRHLQNQEEILLPELRQHPDLAPWVTPLDVDRANVLEQVNDIINMHMDEYSFMKDLRTLLAFIEQHLELTEDTLYEQVRKLAPPSVVASINRRMDAVLFQEA